MCRVGGVGARRHRRDPCSRRGDRVIRNGSRPKREMPTPTRYRVFILEPLDLVIGRPVVLVVQQLLREAPSFVEDLLQSFILFLDQVLALRHLLLEVGAGLCSYGVWSRDDAPMA